MDTSQGLVSRNERCWYKEVCTRESCNSCIKFLEMNFLMTNSNLPKAKQKVITLEAPIRDLAAYQRLGEIKADIYNFVQDGKSLYIASEQSGNGKTSWAIKLMHKYFEEVWEGNCLTERALFVHVPTFLMKCKDFKQYDPEFEKLKRLLLEVDLVVWDDVASTLMSPYDYSQLLIYLDNRSLSELSNIYTGNFPDREKLIEKLGAKLASRVWSTNTEVIIFKGGDIR